MRMLCITIQCALDIETNQPHFIFVGEAIGENCKKIPSVFGKISGKYCEYFDKRKS